MPEATDRRAGCGKSARPVRREGRGSIPRSYPYPEPTALLRPKPNAFCWPLGCSRVSARSGVVLPMRAMFLLRFGPIGFDLVRGSAAILRPARSKGRAANLPVGSPVFGFRVMYIICFCSNLVQFGRNSIAPNSAQKAAGLRPRCQTERHEWPQSANRPNLVRGFLRSTLSDQ